LRLRVRPSSCSQDDPRGVEAAAHQREQRGELREHQRLVPLLDQLGELLQQQVELGAASAARARRVDQAGWQAAWRRRSSASSTSMFARATPTSRRCARRAPAPVVHAQLVVDPPLARAQLAPQRLLGLRRQLGEDLLLAPRSRKGRTARATAASSRR
jgi:hypothetical protein